MAARLDLSADEVRRARRWLVALGALSILGGAAAIAVPAVASVTIAIFVGWLLIFAGVVTGADVWSRRHRAKVWPAALDALLALLVGFYLVLFPLSGTVTLTLLLAIWFFGAGLLRLVAAWQLRGFPGTGLLGLTGVLSIVLGILVVADLPSSAAWAIGLLVGINMVFWGVRAIAFSRLLKF
jgi:uncharacterized membrane protein HdeD (DUF308 family)